MLVVDAKRNGQGYNNNMVLTEMCVVGNVRCHVDGTVLLLL